MKYSNMLNDYSSINLTKLDVLDHLDEIKIGVEYRLNGKKIDYIPATLDEFEKVEVVYETLPGYLMIFSLILVNFQYNSCYNCQVVAMQRIVKLSCKLGKDVGYIK